MLSEFPHFVPLSIKSKQAVENIIGKFPPYSDFNFVSMYSWNVEDKILVSHLNGNLVVQFKDYTSDDVFLSFAGDSSVDETIKTLLKYAHDNQLLPALHLIPEHVINLIKKPSQFLIKEDRDSHDYIVMALKFSELKGKDYASKRNGINKFKAAHAHHAEVKKLKIDERVAKDIITTFHKWREETATPEEEIKNELSAVKRLVKDAQHFNLNTLGIYIDDVMVAYSIYELQGSYAVGHFEKALKSHVGLYDFLKHTTATDLHGQGAQYINYEQDMGIKGLRNAKLLLHPETFLKKYTVTLASR